MSTTCTVDRTQHHANTTAATTTTTTTNATTNATTNTTSTNSKSRDGHASQLDIARFPVATLLRMVANLLESVVHANDKLEHQQNLTIFHSRAVPSIKIEAYLLRILRFTPFNNEVVLSLPIYFDRIAKARKGNFIVSSLNIHRLLISGIVVASKFVSDVFYPNSRYAKVGGLPLLELNQLELEFLFLCDFELHVRLETMQKFGDQLLLHAMSQQQQQQQFQLQQQQQLQEQQQVVRKRRPLPPLTPPTTHHESKGDSEWPVKKRHCSHSPRGKRDAPVIRPSSQNIITSPPSITTKSKAPASEPASTQPNYQYTHHSRVAPATPYTP